MILEMGTNHLILKRRLNSIRFASSPTISRLPASGTTSTAGNFESLWPLHVPPSCRMLLGTSQLQLEEDDHDHDHDDDSSEETVDDVQGHHLPNIYLPQ